MRCSHLVRKSADVVIGIKVRMSENVTE
jgi:predicted amidohydrolase